MNYTHRKNFVYALTDPRTGSVRYVGYSTQGMRRPRQHKYDARMFTDSTRKARWIRQLARSGLDYQIQILEIVNSKRECPSVEKYWIAKYRSEGACLTNLTDGGDGRIGHKVTAKTRRKMIRSHTGMRHSVECRKKIGISHQKPCIDSDGRVYESVGSAAASHEIQISTMSGHIRAGTKLRSGVTMMFL